MARHALTDLDIRNAKPNAKGNDKPYRLFDGEGLAILVSLTGVKSWQFRYKHGQTGRTVTLGKYPTVSLAEARDRAEEQRKILDKGRDPMVAKRSDKLRQRSTTANTFDAMARDWLKVEAKRQKWTDGYRAEVDSSISNHLSDLSGIPVADITAPTLSPILRRVDASAPMMVEKVRRRLNAILDFAVEHGAIVGNPLPAVRRGRKIARRHYPAVVDLPGLGEILRQARAADPCKGIARAHILLAFTALRVSEVVGAKWDEFALEGVNVPIGDTHRMRLDPACGNWSVPRERMKRKDEDRGPHVVPLPPALLAALCEWRAADGEDSVYVCPAPRDGERTITPEGIEKFYRKALGLSGKHSPHSWRSAFSTVAREAGKDGDAIEAQLDHVVGTKVASAYDRAKRLELRRSLLTWYEGQLMAARDGAAVIPIKARH